MSRIGKKPITVPAGVDVKIDGSTVTVKGPKGTLTNTFSADMIIKAEGSEIIVDRPSEDKVHKSLHGLTRCILYTSQ
ncbi:MAG: 50S ribosomal protein L6, partial [Oscillospiraceae bacterium]|nr:50S ribosomal protein L6 [Oscillospiraceae bacterium]